MSYTPIGNQGPKDPIQLPTPVQVDPTASNLPPVAPAVADNLSQAQRGTKRKVDLSGLPPPEGSPPPKKLKGEKWLKSPLVILRQVMEQVIAAMGKVRFESEEAAMQAALWMKEEGLAQAEFGLQVREAEAKSQVAEAQQHLINGITMISAAALTVVAYGGGVARSNSRMKNDKELANLTAMRDTDRQNLNNVSGRPGVDGAPPVPPRSKEVIQERRAKLQKSDEAVSQRQNTIMQDGTHFRSMLTNVISQVSESIKNFTEHDTKLELASLTREKARYEHAQKIAEVYERMAQRMMQTSDQDSKDAREQMAKFLQELDQIISANYKSFGISVHG